MLQNSQVLSFFRPRENGGDWSQRELAEFYRVQDALVNSGVSISTDRGVTDEGEPWFVFYRQDNDEVIVHFARIDGEYVVVSNLAEGIVRGRNFNALVRQLLESHPYVLPKTNSRRQTVFLHPATLLAALVVTGYVKSAEMNSAPDEAGRGDEKTSGWFFNRHDLVAYSAIVIATVWDSLTADSDVHKFTGLGWLVDAKADSDGAGSSNSAHDGNENLLLNDLAFQGPQDHALDASHLAAASAQGLEQQTAHTGTGASDGWAATLAAQIKALGYHGVFSHSNDGDLPASSQDSPAERDGDGKSVGWHSDADSAELAASNGYAEQVVAASRSGISATQPAASAPTDLHGSSNPPPAVQNISSPDAVNALNVVSNTLHMDPQALHPFVLAATNLTDAVQTTLLQLNQANSSTGVTTDPLNISVNATTSPTAGNGAQSPADLVSTAPVHSFDTAAQHSVEEFFKETPNYKVESFGHDLLIVDTNLSHFSSNQFALETWVMPDGSTLSILGLAAHTTALAA
jgi:hypothetical protein